MHGTSKPIVGLFFVEDLTQRVEVLPRVVAPG
jgi:hypothetical protein